MGVDKHNEVALLRATRLYDLSHTNFAENRQSLRAFYDDPTIQAHPEDRCACMARSAKTITGKVAYDGDLWVRKDFRGQGMSQIIAGIGHGVTFAMWAPDFLCGIAPHWRVGRGACELMHHEPGGSILHLVEEDILDDEWLIWLTGQELRSLVHR